MTSPPCRWFRQLTACVMHAIQAQEDCRKPSSPKKIVERPRSVHASHQLPASAGSARRAASCLHATFVQPFTTTQMHAWVRPSFLVSLRPPHASLGPAPPASRKGLHPSSGRCSSLWASGQRALSGSGGSDSLSCVCPFLVCGLGAEHVCKRLTLSRQPH